MSSKTRELTPEEKENLLKLINEDKQKRGEACIKAIATALKRYNCRQNVIIHTNIDTKETTADIQIIPN